MLSQLFPKTEIPQPVSCATAELHIPLSLQQGTRKVGIARVQHTVLLTSRYKGKPESSIILWKLQAGALQLAKTTSPLIGVSHYPTKQLIGVLGSTKNTCYSLLS